MVKRDSVENRRSLLPIDSATVASATVSTFSAGNTTAALRLNQISSHISPPRRPLQTKPAKMPVSTQAAHPLTLIPGPVEFTDEVLSAMATPSQSHVSPQFVEVFGDALALLRKLFMNEDKSAQAFAIAGAGTLGWDFVAANLIEPGENALVLHTGFFADSFADCIKTYGGVPTQLVAPLGDIVPLEQIEAALKEKPYKVVTITHVDTSTGVLSDIKTIAALVRKVSPETLVIVDGVCSVGVEEIRFDDWDLDLVLTAPQKAIGVPAGLSIFIASGRALDVFKARKAPPASYYASLAKWLPVMQNYEAKKASYFSTPPVQNIHALLASLKQILEIPLETRFAAHAKMSDHIKSTIASYGLTQVAVRDGYRAHGMTAVYIPEGVVLPEFLGKVAKHNIVLAGGLHKQIATKYFRIGHMGVSAIGDDRKDFELALSAIKESLAECGYSA
ncbi:pyridoxal phosphate-dependent transferase [Lipomyces oligophaga]|uniref:pyridoxal phosphate-dependent transferase n=1 Tax=Lipomyces oligophaga TaxID=45792 RepID=UPI0034CF747E